MPRRKNRRPLLKVENRDVMFLREAAWFLFKDSDRVGSSEILHFVQDGQRVYSSFPLYHPVRWLRGKRWME